MYSLRPMLSSDDDAVIALARRNHSLSRYSDLSFDADGVRDLVHLMSNSRMAQGYVLVHDQSGVVGIIAGMVAKLPWLIEPTASETFFTVHPDHRGYKQAMMLLRAYVGWAKMSGAKLISVNADNDDASDVRTVVLYNRAGFKSAGRTMSMKGD